MDHHDEAPVEAPARLEVTPTGVADVDAVQEEIASLGERPVSEHVAVFERAHEQLRRSLDAPSAD